MGDQPRTRDALIYPRLDEYAERILTGLRGSRSNHITQSPRFTRYSNMRTLDVTTSINQDTAGASTVRKGTAKRRRATRSAQSDGRGDP